jgi:mono/diheme cytochrome c family protein
MTPPRSSIIAQAGAQLDSQPSVESTSDLYNLFKAVCGACHVDSNLGNFSVTRSTFSTLVNSTVYGFIVSDDPAIYMPPTDTPDGLPFSQRPTTDVVYQLATQLNLWLQQGSPRDQFTLPASTAPTSAGYAIGAALGAQLTNIGSCIPDTRMVATDQTTMAQLDTMFAQATDLPATLDQTDLTTLDSAILARTGVISYAPAYPLWSDNAQQQRYVRVPAGQSIVFDRSTQSFTIPPNTRFYDTYLKEIKDVTGGSTYRKIETRLIVSRPDTNLPDGTAAQQNAIFGTYLWNQDETQAALLTEPLRDGEPFANRIFTYVTDEQKAQSIINSAPVNLEAALEAAGVTRHYAVPSSERCMDCHLGSPSQSFVAGFTPLQIARRANGEGGVYEAATGDELTQLQRLIDYGVITGLSSPGDVLPLEMAEGTRRPRNVHELNAQAYLLGNCAHCHNPRGDPSLNEPALATVLNFLPGPGPYQGIFQFPLDTASPIRNRGLSQVVPMPYITPSLYDLPSDGDISKYFCPDQQDGSCEAKGAVASWVLAPWRSLIYRNIDTPYDYFDDLTPFPHMPQDTSGYDCRAAQLMGDWMVSIPGKLKTPATREDALPDSTGSFPSDANSDPQPYVEVLPGDADYDAAVAAAALRLSDYHNRGFRYGFCPSTYTDDIVDPLIQAEVDANLPVTADLQEFFSPTSSGLMVMPLLTPIRPHYVSFDDTDPPGDWFPRRSDWATALVNPDVSSYVAREMSNNQLQPDAAIDLANVMTSLGAVTLTNDVRNALSQKVPFGLWDTTTPGCTFSNIPTAGSFTGTDRPQWMTSHPPPATAPVYMASAGGAIFTETCVACHGVDADSSGLMADEISDLTGGAARVANLLDGLLGPTSSPGTNRDRVFGSAAGTLGVTSDDLAARYIAWMSLGGTQKYLPQDVLMDVSEMPVLGVVRSHIDVQGTPDMLRLGLSLCEQIVGAERLATPLSLSTFFSNGEFDWSHATGLVDSNGDAEMWLRVCNLGNRPIVRVPSVQGGSWTANSIAGTLTVTGNRLYWATGPDGESYYGANPVMDHLGNVVSGVTADNLFPICVEKPGDPTQLEYATRALAATPVNHKNVMPFCPDGFVQSSHQLQVDTSTGVTAFTDARKWAARGAINAALAVFVYLDQVEKDPSQRQPLYTQCNLIGSGE